MKMVVLGEISFWISLLLCFLNLKPTPLLADEASELLENYDVHSKSVYFLDELEDVIYFRGSAIELHCHASCGQECIGTMKINHNGTAELKFDETFYDNKTTLTIRINNASVIDSGFYQCLRPVWPWTMWEPYIAEIAGRKIHVQITDLGPAEDKVKFISNGDSTLLPCAINASNNVYPAPDGIEWRKDDRHLEDEEDSFITQDNSLLITNITANVSYQCVVHWRAGPVPDYNGSHYQLVIGQPAAYHATVHPKGVKVKVGERVQFVCVASGFGQNYTIKWYNSNNSDNPLVTINHSHVLDIPLAQLNNSGSYYCVVKNEFAEFVSNISPLQVIEPPHIINISSDVLINTSVINNVILNCSFTGDLTHTMVYWMKGNQNLTERTNVMNNTANLNLTIDVNTDDFMGSFQCVVTNEAGYVSRTARVLPKGWTSAPRNVNVIIDYYSIDNCSIIVSWNPPVYNGGLLIQYCYKVEVNYGDYFKMNSLLGDCITTTSISWDGCKHISEIDDIKFKITVVDEYKNERSMVQNKKLTTPELLLNLMVNCAGNDVIANWELTSYPYNIDEYCLKYWCDTVHKEMCYTGRAMNNASISGVPVHNTTCRFLVIAKGEDRLEELNSNNVMCRSPVAPSITLSEEEEKVIEGDSITCTATSHPAPDVVWLNNDESVVDKDRLKTNHSMGVGNLSIVSVSMIIGRNDAGVYKCIAINSIGNDTRTINITVHSIPVIDTIETEQVYNITEGDSITCTATGYPVPDIVWLNNDGSVVDENRIKTDSAMATGVGNLYNVSVSMIVGRNDAGVYECNANNSIGDDVQTIDIIVNSIPIITVPKNGQLYTLTEGDNITCTATGYPVPDLDIVWLNNDESNNRLVTDSLVADNDSVSVSLTIRRSDTGIYSCVANNSVGNIIHAINVTVQWAPVIITQETEQVIVANEGDSITCTATAHPEPDIMWLNNGSVVDEDRIISRSIIATGVANTYNVSASMIVRRGDTGIYTCLANNSVGNDTRIFNITVQSNLVRTNNTSYVYFWLLTLLVVTVIMFLIALFIIKGRMKRINYEPPPGILDTKVADFDEFVTDTPSRIEVFIGDDESDCSSIKECDVENSKMLEEIMYKGDPVITAISLTSIVDSNSMDNNIVNRESSSHYFDSSSSSNNSNNSSCSSNTGNSVQTQHYDSGNPVVDNNSITNEGSAYNDR